MSRRLMIDLDDHDQAVLARVAGGDPADAQALARAVIVDFLRGHEDDPQELADMLDRIPGAWERAPRRATPRSTPARASLSPNSEQFGGGPVYGLPRPKRAARPSTLRAACQIRP